MAFNIIINLILITSLIHLSIRPFSIFDNAGDPEKVWFE